MPTRVLVAGAGGSIGHQLVGYLSNGGDWVQGADIKSPDYEASLEGELILLECRIREELCREPLILLNEGFTQTYRWIEPRHGALPGAFKVD